MIGDQRAGAGTVAAPAAQQGVFRLIYSSRSRMPGGEATRGLADILRVSRANNAKCGVTGALMLHGETFAQILEGPEDEVRRTFGRISADARHDQVAVREDSMAAARVFSRWAMANVGEQGQADSPMLPVRSGTAEDAPWSVAEGAHWRVTPEQEPILATLRALTRGRA